ncbi:sugar kinase [Streptomyces violens]|uniref:sugar kinase n=1 Tax=Streptomyces violens TaxID=66377 RepID=UPI00068F1929|nr:sugar kinase [Streptomyces violens]
MSAPFRTPLTVPARDTGAGPEILALGEPLVEFSADSDGALEDAVRFTLGYGGDTSNMAIAASRSGARTGYLTRVGGDAFGALLLDLWTRNGIDISGVIQEPDGDTGLYFITRHAGEGHRFTYRRAGSAAARLTPADVPEEALARARLLHVSGITQAVSSSACDAALHAMRTARAAGTLVSYDPNHRPALWPLERARATALHSASLADIVLPNLEEGRLLTGEESPEAVAECFARRGPAVVALKMGAEGVLLSERGRLTRIPAHRVRAVDATGAGDTFDGAFAARLLAGDTAGDAARYAVVAAALTTTGHGAVAPIPDRKAVEEARSAAA